MSGSLETSLAEAISALGTTGFEAAFWRVCQGVAQPDNLVVLAYRDGGPPLVLQRVASNPRVFARLESTYVAGAYRLDPYFDLHLRQTADGAYRIRDIAPDAFQRSRYFLEYFGATTLIDEIAFVVRLGPGLSLNLCLGRDAVSGRAFSAAELAACHQMAPVMSALARAHWRGLDTGEGAVEDTPGLLVQAARDQHGIALSQRQATVALMILRGHSTASIGLTLGISPQTVKVFRKQLYARCEISSQGELFALMLPLLNAG
jgi:DNA-binding CsgD family transcriptional regulator